MSKIKVQQPIIHIPSFKEFAMSAEPMRRLLTNLKLTIPMGMLDSWYYYTDMEGWGKVLYNLVFSSSLYKPNRFDCENYALKAMNICAERYGLNTLAMVIGDVPQGRHGFNMFYTGENFLLFEPNEGFPFSGSAFEIGEYNYQPKLVLV